MEVEEKESVRIDFYFVYLYYYYCNNSCVVFFCLVVDVGGVA